MGDEQTSEVAGFILAGGRSSRMGVDKASLKLGHHTFVELIARALSELTKDVSIVGGTEQQRFHELKFIPDIHPFYGALGGIQTALNSCQKPWAFIVACDLPFVTPQFLRSLWQHRQGFAGVIPVQRDGRLQPLCALYAREPCLSVAESLIKNGERRPRTLIALIRAYFISEDSPGLSNVLMNINTPDDYREAQEGQLKITETKTSDSSRSGTAKPCVSKKI